MIATQTAEMLGRLSHGACDPQDTSMLEHVKATDLVAELRSVYRLTFQERRLRNKWEISLARALWGALIPRSFPGSLFVGWNVVPVYRDCLMLSIEDNSITGISRLTKLTVRAVRKPSPALLLTTGKGFKLDNAPDGWSIKPMKKKTVKLTEPFLRDRGWQFDHLNQVCPTS
jgi:hypothetical protein